MIFKTYHPVWEITDKTVMRKGEACEVKKVNLKVDDYVYFYDGGMHDGYGTLTKVKKNYVVIKNREGSFKLDNYGTIVQRVR